MTAKITLFSQSAELKPQELDVTDRYLVLPVERMPLPRHAHVLVSIQGHSDWPLQVPGWHARRRCNDHTPGLLATEPPSQPLNT